MLLQINKNFTIYDTFLSEFLRNLNEAHLDAETSYYNTQNFNFLS